MQNNIHTYPDWTFGDGDSYPIAALLERHNLSLIKTANGWACGRFTDDFQAESELGYFCTESGVVDGVLAGFEIAPTPIAAVQKAVLKRRQNFRNAD